MNTPNEEVESQPTGNGPGEIHAAAGPMDVPTAIEQLRTLVCGLGAALLIVSLVLTAFVYKQNRNLMGTIAARQRQLSQLQVNGQVLDYAVNELARYSDGKPELMALFAKHGVEITPPAAAGQPVTVPKN